MTLSQDRSSILTTRIQQSVQVDSAPDQELEVPTDCPIRFAVSLKGLTTWKVGGLAQYYLEPRTLAETQTGLAWARQNDLEITIIGAGSNLLISDRGLPEIGRAHV